MFECKPLYSPHPHVHGEGCCEQSQRYEPVLDGLLGVYGLLFRLNLFSHGLRVFWLSLVRLGLERAVFVDSLGFIRVS